ncbi:Lysosomal Pro-X carboxypeptidase precursor [Paragonimus heterotremus]|uniref:Lysosomal Pro-X carboxypeptidase n=1 Tax=Paragonimus heterotremus TaxID=100268 RepID=A0A8J4T4G7_9TREM|nr:Lysosomal Pro-X carboxypeptidase precursor [Paragonimus heterotremus]
MLLVAIILLLGLVSSANSVFTLRSPNPMRFMTKSPKLANGYVYETRYIDVLLDHFSFADVRTFKLKYLISTEFHEPHGPVLFYTGNEGPIETFAENTGFMWEHAEELKAALVFAEHRFYGSSLPFGNETFKDVEHFGYMTAEQALADFVSVIEHLQLTNENFTNAPVIALGGSYGGILAAWFRNKYPNLVAGAIAASAPVWMFPNMSSCGEFNRIATDTFVTSGSEECRQSITAVWNSIQEVSKGPAGLQFLYRAFTLCKPLVTVQPLIDYLVDFVGLLAMVNYPYEASFVGEFPAEPVKYFCRNMNAFSSRDQPVDVVLRTASAVRSVTNYTKQQKCIVIDDDLPGLGVKAWDIQTCMEMTIPMCATGVKDMFPPMDWDAEVFSEACFKKYGVRPRMSWSDKQFWGKRLQTASKIVFSNGDLDPWSGFGVQRQEDVPQCHVIRIPNGAHHLDLRASNPLDPADVIDARKQELDFIKTWIREWKAT